MKFSDLSVLWGILGCWRVIARSEKRFNDSDHGEGIRPEWRRNACSGVNRCGKRGGSQQYYGRDAVDLESTRRHFTRIIRVGDSNGHALRLRVFSIELAFARPKYRARR
jgi:hypothetical protein